MGFREVLISLNNLREIGIIREYAIFGGYAVMLYGIPMSTYDLDVLVFLPTPEDYHRIYEYYHKKGARIENVFIHIEGMPVQFFPHDISPLHSAAIEEANNVDFEGIQCRFVSLEYLILLLLTSFRPKDRIRLQDLCCKANKDSILEFIQRFDDSEHSLYKKYKKIVAVSQ